MFGGRFPAKCDETGSYFIDANGDLFKYVLDFLRRNQLTVPRTFDNYNALLLEAEYFNIRAMINNIRQITNSDIVTLNVGGTRYSMPLHLMDKYRESTLYTVVRGQTSDNMYDDHGVVYIDADGHMFRYVLNFLRRNELILPDDFKEFDLLLLESEYYGIASLTECIRKAHHRFDVMTVNVQGVLYHTTGKTLRKYPHSSLSMRMLNTLDERGRCVIAQGDGQLFQYVLDYLRKGNIDLPSDFKHHEELLNEALLYDIPSMVACVRSKMTKCADDEQVL